MNYTEDVYLNFTFSSIYCGDNLKTPSLKEILNQAMEEFVIVFCQHHHTEVKDTYADQFSSLKDIQHSADLGHQWLGSCTNSMGHSLIADNCVTLCGLINSIESRSTSCFCAGRV